MIKVSHTDMTTYRVEFSEGDAKSLFTLANSMEECLDDVIENVVKRGITVLSDESS